MTALFGIVAVAAPERPANELGRIPILEYHKIDRPEGRWTRTPENFRGDLERLWRDGYRLVPLGDLLHDRMNLPAGTSPVVLTFDDSSPGQFRYITSPGGFAPADPLTASLAGAPRSPLRSAGLTRSRSFANRDGEPVIDPDCAVGILERFEREHPAFGHAATFYVLPGADPPNRLFNQPALAARKLQYLASHGYEIGNHTLWHAELSKYGEPMVRRQLALAQRDVDRAVPGYRLRTLALPLGAYPADPAWAVSGSADGTSYQHDAVLKVAGGTAPSPYDRAFDPYRLPRLQAIESELRIWLTNFERHAELRFVSDGDPRTIAVPPGARDRVAPAFASRVR